MDYFGIKHLPYAIPAVLVLLLLSVPPPLLLISYPLLWNITAKTKCTGKLLDTENDTTVWIIRKFLPLIDSFQGVFRDNRMFAALLFLWRAILTAIVAFSSNFNEFFLLTEIALLCFLTIHAVARPYKRRLHNIIDLVMLANMAIINALMWYIFSTSLESRANKAIEAAVSIKIVLMYLPLLSLAVIVILRLLRRYGLTLKLHFLTSEEGEPNAVDSHNSSIRKMIMHREESCADEDLFD